MCRHTRDRGGKASNTAAMECGPKSDLDSMPPGQPGVTPAPDQNTTKSALRAWTVDGTLQPARPTRSLDGTIGQGIDHICRGRSLEGRG